jgi:hypothetical protein
MADYRQIAPRIFWGASLSSAADFGYPLDNVQADSPPRDGSSWVQGPSGDDDSWITGYDYTLEGDYRWIPKDHTADGPRFMSGWDPSDGVREFLKFARDRNVLRFHPDSRNLVPYPKLNADSNSDGIVDGWGSSTGGVSTLSFDATNAAQRVLVNGGGNTTGSLQYGGINQIVARALPGEQFCITAEYRLTAVVNGVQLDLAIHFLDGAGSIVGTSDTLGNAAAGFTVLSSGLVTAPAGTVSVQALPLLSVPNGATSAGDLRVRNVMIRRANASTTFIDNPFITVKLIDPMQGAADQRESDGTRKLRLKFRNITTPFDGY